MARRKDKRPFWTLDAETDPFKYQRVPKPFIWGLYTGAGFHTFRKTEDMVECIREQDVIVYAHNGGKFDFHLLLDHINRNEDMKQINGRIASAPLGKCELRDSYLLFPAPLSSFGAKLSIDYALLEEDVREKHMPEITRYLQADCVELWNALDAHESTYGRHLTQAGSSAKQWEMIADVKMPRTDKRFFTKFSEYYFGGRVNVFEKGYIKGPVGVWDIRSAYPWAMLSEHPYDPNYIEITYPKSVHPTDMVIVECISTGALPFRDDRGLITYPRDAIRRRYKIPGHEILAGIETGSVRDVHYINAIRFAGQRDFKPYVDHFYNKRKAHRVAARDYREAGDDKAAEREEVEVFFAKRYMTGLYGKFAANPQNYGNYMCVGWDEKFSHEEDGYYFDGKMGNFALLRRDLDPWQEHYLNIATAASITSQVRAKLWRALNASDGPIYCDTDCVFARAAPDLEIGDELGQWNKEGVASDVYMAGKKLYYLKGSFENGKREKMASKGVRPDPKKIKAAALGKTVSVTSDAPTFTLKGERGVYFQKRNIRMTAGADVPTDTRVKPRKDKALV